MSHPDDQARLNFFELSPELVRKLQEFGVTVANSADFEPSIGHLVDIRASQINGCAACLDMHVKKARLEGERELRLHHVAIWRDSPLFNAKERLALAWTEALTRLGPEGVPDGLYAEAREAFGERSLSTLTFRVVGINAANRLNVAARTPPGAHDKALGLDKANLG